MIKSDSKCRIDGVEVGHVRLSMFGSHPELFAKYALTVTSSGARCGAGRRNQNWSEETWRKVQELIESMERDIIAEIFEEVPVSATTTTRGVEMGPPTPMDTVPGI